MSRIFCMIAEGDSITANAASFFYGAAGVTGPHLATGTDSGEYWPFLNGTTVCLNRAIPGSRLLSNPTDLVQRSAAWVDALLPSTTPGPKSLTAYEDTRPTRTYILSLMIGSNNDTGVPATHVASMATYISARIAAGFAGVIVCTIPDRGDGIVANFNSAYSSPINALLRGSSFLNQFGVPCVCADLASDSRWGADGANANTTYFSSDKIHPTAALYAAVQPIYNAAVDAVKALL